jgi:hypothetical protein
MKAQRICMLRVQHIQSSSPGKSAKRVLLDEPVIHSSFSFGRNDVDGWVI